jgi:acetyl esterase
MDAMTAGFRQTARELMRAAHGPTGWMTPPLHEVSDLTVDGGDGPIPARLYVPEGPDTQGPGLVFFHGGGFFSCDLDTHDGMCRWLAAAARARVLSVAYRLAPEHRLPAQFDDALAATRWAIAHAADIGFDPARLATGGDSVGGLLSAVTAVKLNRERPGRIKVQLLIYPMFNIGEKVCSAEEAIGFRMLGQAAAWLVQSQAISADGKPPTDLDGDLGASPRTLIFSGGLDPLRAEAQGFADRLRAAGVSVTDKVFPQLAHGGLNFPSAAGPAREWLVEVATALGAALRE